MTGHEQDRAFLRWLRGASTPELCRRWTKETVQWKLCAIAHAMKRRGRRGRL